MVFSFASERAEARRRTFLAPYGGLSARTSGGDPDCRLGRATPPDQPLQLVDVDSRDRQESRLAQREAECDQVFGSPAQEAQIVVEAAQLFFKEMQVVHALRLA